MEKKTSIGKKKPQLQMFYHNKWNLFRQTFRQGGTMFDCFSWARKNATRESIMGSKYFWNFIILLYFFGSVRVLYICITFVPKNARLQCNLADWNAIWRYFASMQLLFILSMSFQRKWKNDFAKASWDNKCKLNISLVHPSELSSYQYIPGRLI